MFKKYTLRWSDVGGRERSTDFYTYSAKTRDGFQHMAAAIGPLPRLDDSAMDVDARRANDERLARLRFCRVRYVNRTWESWLGQTCLARLWDQLKKPRFMDMGRISTDNPFGGEEPESESLPEPEAIFEPWTRRRR